ncbi:MAG: VOC family protein [Anaerolineales bacterium]|nr:VOC family protein [Anaerolineales bacterium]
MTSRPLDDNKVIQIGLVVENIDEAVQAWSLLLGVTPPSIIITETVDVAHTQYHDSPTPAQARLAFFDLGQVALELIQPVGSPSTWNDQLTAHGPSLHHLAFEIKGMEKHIRELAKHGLRLIQRGEYTGGRYAYVDGQKQFGTVIELLEND